MPYNKAYHHSYLISHLPIVKNSALTASPDPQYLSTRPRYSFSLSRRVSSRPFYLSDPLSVLYSSKRQYVSPPLSATRNLPCSTGIYRKHPDSWTRSLHPAKNPTKHGYASRNVHWKTRWHFHPTPTGDYYQNNRYWSGLQLPLSHRHSRWQYHYTDHDDSR